MKILAISGSLRAASINTMLIRAMRRLAPPQIEIEAYAGLAALPFFNPDLECALPESVIGLKAQITNAAVILIASPEYAHGVTGVLKNALDWIVSSEVLVNKPVMVLNASPRATHADAALRETLSVMSADIIEAASVTVPLVGAQLDEEAVVRHPGIAHTLRCALLAAHGHWLQQQ